MGDSMNKTKVIATIGPASSSKEIIKELIKNGLDVVRLNLSHADYSFCMDIINKVNELNNELKTTVAIMLDTKGPEIRTNKFRGGEAYLKKGETIKLYKENILGDEKAFSINVPSIFENIKHNMIIKLDDGKIELEVINKSENFLECVIKNDGIIRDNKGVHINCPRTNVCFLSDKDKEDIKFANMMNVDFLALSFVSNEEDILLVNDELINLRNDHISIIAKIENERALNSLDEIIKVSDGVMVARGDLGVEIPIERIPSIQKLIIDKCHNKGKLSIIATELLSSMEYNKKPTKAEVSDIANAVTSGIDAVMLSGETTIGRYPVLALQTLERIINFTEKNINFNKLMNKAMRTETQDITGLIAYSVVSSANKLKARAIIVPTYSGYTAKKISRFRPTSPIVALSPSKNTVKSLMLNFGVFPMLMEEVNSFDKIITRSRKISKEVLKLVDDDLIIITGGYPLRKVNHTNFMKIEKI